MFTDSDWYKQAYESKVIQVQGILRSGVPTGASLKGVIKIKEYDEDEEEVDEKKEDKPKETEESMIKEGEPQDEPEVEFTDSE